MLNRADVLMYFRCMYVCMYAELCPQVECFGSGAVFGRALAFVV
jgi:hypothetical protein